jgi:L-methionine (R)-S-oxide reductase
MTYVLVDNLARFPLISGAFRYFRSAMAEGVVIPETADRAARYEALIPQLKALTDGESDLIANLANVTAALHQAFGWHWTGCYLVKGNELVLGPFQGPVACTRIGFGKGVCGTAWAENRTVCVPDVEEFPGHIACSALSRSELVVPMRDASGMVWGVIDLDSPELNGFDETDARCMERIALMISHSIAR